MNNIETLLVLNHLIDSFARKEGLDKPEYQLLVTFTREPIPENVDLENYLYEKAEQLASKMTEEELSKFNEAQTFEP